MLTGDKPYFYYYDVQSGAVSRVANLINGSGKAERSLSTFAISPNGQWLAFAASSGFIMLVSARSKQWIADFKLNCRVTTLVFSSDNRYVLASGPDAELYKFDVRQRRCLQRMHNEVRCWGCNHLLQWHLQYSRLPAN